MNSLLFLSLVGISHIISGGKVEKGSGIIKEEARSVSGFTGISISDGIEAQLSPGPFKVQVKGDDNILPLLETTVKNGVIHVNIKDDQSYQIDKALQVFIQVPAIDLIRLSAASRVTGDIKALDKLKFDLSSGSRVRLNTVNGKKLEISTTSSSDVTLDQFTGNELKIDASSGSSVALSHLKVDSAVIDASSSSDIELSGTSDKIAAELSSGSTLKANQLKVKDAHLDGSSASEVRLKGADAVSGKVSSGAKVYVARAARVSVKQSSGAQLIQD